MNVKHSPSHTPGPWHYRPFRYDDWGFVRAFDGAVLVARALARCSPEEEDRHRANGTDPYEANARLIAAAPDLLAALNGVVNASIDPSVCPHGEERPECCDACGHATETEIAIALNVARAAIAKAEGAA